MKGDITKKHKEWREEVLKNFQKCAVCGQKKYLNAHHLVPWQFKEYRFEQKNGIALCPSHHTLHKFSAHKNPIWFTKWLMENHYKSYKWAMDIIWQEEEKRKIQHLHL